MKARGYTKYQALFILACLTLAQFAFANNSSCQNTLGCTSASIIFYNKTSFPFVITANPEQECMQAPTWASGIPLSSGTSSAPGIISDGPLEIFTQGGSCSSASQTFHATYTYPNGENIYAECTININNNSNPVSCSTSNSNYFSVTTTLTFSTWTPFDSNLNLILFTINPISPNAAPTK